MAVYRAGQIMMLDDRANGTSLSIALRKSTAQLHRDTEAVLQLPMAIESIADYRAWLGRFLGLYAPLEAMFATFPDWQHHGFPPSAGARSQRIEADLAWLGVDPATLPRVPAYSLPSMPGFAHAVGGFYVLSGAALGGKFILRDLESRIGGEIAGATQFFGGRIGAAETSWATIRDLLDTFGATLPEARADVIAGAERVFAAILAWFAPADLQTEAWS
jgi:heme oxygenase